MLAERQPIVWVQRPGNAPEQIRAQEFPLAFRVHELIVDRGYRAIWVMVDQGVHDAPRDPTCWELEKEHM